MGRDAGAWYNKDFVRGSPSQSKNIIKTKTKTNTNGKSKSRNRVARQMDPKSNSTTSLPYETTAKPIVVPYGVKQSDITAELCNTIISEARLVLSIDSALSALSKKNHSFPSVECTDSDQNMPGDAVANAYSNNELAPRMPSINPSQPIDCQAATPKN